MDFNKLSLFGVKYSILDYVTASDIIINKARKRISYAVSALAVHGLISSLRNKNIGDLVRKINMVVPDGQPIRWALNSFYKIGLKDRVYGPDLTLHVLGKANRNNLNVFLFGSTKGTLNRFEQSIKKNYLKVNICGIHIDRFRDATLEEDIQDIKKINESGAHIVLVGRGCPRQEIWVSEHLGKVNAVMMAVGAAFDFIAGNKKQAPRWMQNSGLEWLFRLMQEPRRLWERYLITNSYFIYLFLKHKFILKRPF